MGPAAVPIAVVVEVVAPHSSKFTTQNLGFLLVNGSIAMLISSLTTPLMRRNA